MFNNVDNYRSIPFIRGADELLQTPGSMSVPCFDGVLMRLTFVGTTQYKHSEEHPLIHFDRHLGGGWSSVYYASSKSDRHHQVGYRPSEEQGGS